MGGRWWSVAWPRPVRRRRPGCRHLAEFVAAMNRSGCPGCGHAFVLRPPSPSSLTNHVLGDREDTAGEQRPECSVKPKMNISTPARIFELLDSEPDFAECNFSGEKQLAGLSGDEFCDGSSRFRSAEFRYDVGIEEPPPQRFTSRTVERLVSRSNYTSASGDVANASTISRPEIGRRMRQEFIRPDATASRPCSVTRCGPRAVGGLAHQFAQARLGVPEERHRLRV